MESLAVFDATVAWLSEVRDTLTQKIANGNGWMLADADGDPSIDVRVQRFDGEWFFHSGDASYDTDCRGLWGGGNMIANLTDSDADLKLLADDLLMQVLDAEEDRFLDFDG